VSETPLQPYFDDSLPAFVAALMPLLDKTMIEASVVLRDASGRLALITSQPLPPEQRTAILTALTRQLPAYSRGERTLLDHAQPGVATILRQTRPYIERVKIGDESPVTVYLAEQRIVGQDWLTQPAPGWQPPAPMRLVFASLKGGVGRSTALAVVAAELARLGRKVLVIDLDLEAPGIGSMLLAPDELPQLGLLDAYVESGLGGVSREFLLDMTAPSRFGRGKGLIDVAPAAGARTQTHPGHFLAKIARAYLENTDPNGAVLSFLEQSQRLINELSGLKAYDAILIDARSGLNETTAAAILGLGADVLLFGEGTPQTIASYRYLLAHLARFPRQSDDDWLYRLRMVHAKAPEDADRQQAFRDAVFGIFTEFLYRDLPLLSETGEPLLGEDDNALLVEEFSLDAREAPHYAWPVLRDANYYYGDPLSDPALLEPIRYERSYAALLAGVMERLGADSGIQP
jgi:hypothetical protein